MLSSDHFWKYKVYPREIHAFTSIKNVFLACCRIDQIIPFVRTKLKNKISQFLTNVSIQKRIFIVIFLNWNILHAYVYVFFSVNRMHITMKNLYVVVYWKVSQSEWAGTDWLTSILSFQEICMKHVKYICTEVLTQRE